MTELKRRVKHYAIDHNTTIATIAEHCGLSYSAFCCKLNNTRDWKMQEAYALCNLLGVSLDEFGVMANIEMR